MEAINVRVNGKIKQYPVMIAEFGNFLAAGGNILALFEALQNARQFFRGTTSDAWRSLSFWVTLDESGLAYHVSINRHGAHVIEGASPLPGYDNVKDVYEA